MTASNPTSPLKDNVDFILQDLRTADELSPLFTVQLFQRIMAFVPQLEREKTNDALAVYSGTVRACDKLKGIDRQLAVDVLEWFIMNCRNVHVRSDAFGILQNISKLSITSEDTAHKEQGVRAAELCFRFSDTKLIIEEAFKFIVVLSKQHEASPKSAAQAAVIILACGDSNSIDPAKELLQNIAKKDPATVLSAIEGMYDRAVTNHSLLSDVYVTIQQEAARTHRTPTLLTRAIAEASTAAHKNPFLAA